MNCKVFLEVKKGDTYEKIYVGSSDSEITEYGSIKKLLSKLDVETIQKLLEALPNIDEVTDINIADITENSVGVLSPTDLFNDIKKSQVDNRYTSVLAKLNIDSSIWNKQIVISGFGSPNVRTQYFNNHIFLNLNYVYDEDNKALAIFETALYLSDPDNYDTNSKNLIKDDISSEEKLRIISSAFKGHATEEDYNFIKGLYDISKLKGSVAQDIEPVEIRDAVYNFIQKFTPISDRENREFNYGPTQDIRLENVKQGDLIKVSFREGDKSKDVFELFYDYTINKNGEIIVKTNRIGNAEIYNRIFPSDVVSIRKYSPDVINNFNRRTDGVEVSTTGKLYFSKYKYTLKLIKDYGSSVSGINDNGEKVEGKIKSLKGSIITLEDGNTLNISKVKKVTTNIKSDTTFNTYNSLEEVPNLYSISYHKNLKTIPIGSRILIKNGNTYTEGLVLVKGTTSNRAVDSITYVTNINGKTEVDRVSFKDIEYIIPSTEHYISKLEETKLSTLKNNLYSKNSVHDYLANKNGELRDFGYSIEKINITTSLVEGDIILQPINKRYFKVVEVNNKNIILSTMINNKLEYVGLSDDLIKDGILFSKDKVNQTFADAYFRKNGPKITHFTSKLPNVVSIEANVYKKQNGFIYAIDKNSKVENSKLYSKGDININNEYRQYLRDRFNVNIDKNAPLYIEQNIESGKGFLHDQNNTTYWDITNFDELFENLHLLVPGTFITFTKDNKTEHNNAKAFIVEKVVENGLLLSSYHYTSVPTNNITSQKVLFTKEDYDRGRVDKDAFKAVSLYVPNWATRNIGALNNIILKPGIKASKLLKYSSKDNPEVIRAIADIIKTKYGLNINYISNIDLKDFKGLDVANSAAFLLNGEIYINMDKASIEEPVHEFLHIILANLKASNADSYYILVNSIENHPYFNKISRTYSGDINIEQLEETFIKILTETFKNNLPQEEFINDEVFEESMKKSLSELLVLNADIINEDVFELFAKSINEVMTMFDSNLLKNEDGLIDFSNAFGMLELSSIIKQLMENGNLKEICN